MELNRKSHPECVYASNPYHECASACLERIAQGHGKKHTKKQASKILNISASLGKKKKESESSPYASKPYQNNAFPDNNYPKDYRSTPRPKAVKKNTFIEEKKSFSSSSSEELLEEQYSRDESFQREQEQLPQTVLQSPNNLVVERNKGGAPILAEKEHNKENGAMGEIRSFDFLSPPRSHDHDIESNDDNDDDENNAILGEEIEVESVMSESCVSVGKYRVKPAASTILRSIIDKHGDIAANCKLESASMRARHLECLCSLVQELKSTPIEQLTKLKIKEMLAVLKDLDSVNIDVGWLRSALEEFAQYQDAEEEKERHEYLSRSTRQALEDQEADLARIEKELVEVRSRVEQARARLVKLEKDRSRFEEIGMKVEKFKGKSFLDELL